MSDTTIGGPIAERTAHVRSDIVRVELSSIIIGTRKRQPERSSIDQLKESIAQQGLLQPIGVWANGAAQFQLLYGAGRMAALLELRNEGRLADSSVPAIVYPADMPAWQGELAEIAENLFRQELTTAERDAHTLHYVGLLKKYGDVAAVDKSAIATSTRASGPAAHAATERKPTVIEQAAVDLGVDKHTISSRVGRAARSVGRMASAEKTDADALMEIGVEAAKRAANGRTSPDARIAKLLAKAEQQPGTKIGDVMAGIEAWWQARHPGGEVIFHEVRVVH